jgi:hypothetical protein
MFTPLQQDSTFSIFGSYRNFNITLNDTCESYFFGHRGESPRGYKAPCWLTAIRIASLMTIIIPLILLITFFVTLLLIRSNPEETEKWKTKVHVTTRQSLFAEDARVASLISRSGLKETPFEHLCFLKHHRGDTRISFDADGHFPQFRPNSIGGPVLLFRYNFSQNYWTTESIQKATDYMKQQCDAEQQATVLGGGKIDDFLLYLGKIPNRLKERLILGPDSPKTSNQLV